jgi:xylulose-5-phosphate/fructose-6-phosphate phosphoketolase
VSLKRQCRHAHRPLTPFRAWHAIKYLDPRESGAVIPILHVNGFKISERTIFGCMDDKEIVCLFTGYGYQVRIVEDLDNIDDELQSSLEWAVAEIKKIQHAARSGKPIAKPRWPMLVLRTPKVSRMSALLPCSLSY